MEENLKKILIGKNADVIYEKMEKGGSFNVFSMLLSFLYFFYRKMYLIGLISFVIQLIIANYAKNAFVSIACMILYGFIFYPLYKYHIERKLSAIKQKATTEEEMINMCKKKGGTSNIAIIIIILSPFILFIVGFLLYTMSIVAQSI